MTKPKGKTLIEVFEAEREREWKRIEQKVGELVGEASTLFGPGNVVFDTTRASRIVDDVMKLLRHVEKKGVKDMEVLATIKPSDLKVKGSNGTGARERRKQIAEAWAMKMNGSQFHQPWNGPMMLMVRECVFAAIEEAVRE